MHAIQQQYWAVRDYLSPVLKESKFKEHGRITPEEFVAAGDFLAYKFPVWSWEQGDASKVRDFLPADKQYLLTRGVPCLRRASTLAYTDAEEDAERLLSFAEGGAAGDGEEWVETHAGRKSTLPNNTDEIAVIPDLDDPSDVADGATSAMGKMSLSEPVGEIPDLDDIPDIDEAEDEAAADIAPAVPSKAEEDTSKAALPSNLLSVRTYDVMITYDKFYQTPRIWLLGYDENGTPLTPNQIFQDVSADYAFKTVTIEPFPNSASLQAASVHPCKHASVMKKVIERMNAGVVEEQRKLGMTSSSSKDTKKKWFSRKTSGIKDDKSGGGEEEEVEGMRVDFYLVVFLKFIASIVPTIEVDSTTAF